MKRYLSELLWNFPLAATVGLLGVSLTQVVFAQNTTSGAPPPPPPPDAAQPDWCPAGIEGTRVETKDLGESFAMEFTTQENSIAELRNRVDAMAKMHNSMPEGMPMAAEARVELIPKGARLVLTPKDKAQTRSFRDMWMQHAGMMQGGGCPAGMMGGPPSGRGPQGGHMRGPGGGMMGGGMPGGGMMGPPGDRPPQAAPAPGRGMRRWGPPPAAGGPSKGPTPAPQPEKAK